MALDSNIAASSTPASSHKSVGGQNISAKNPYLMKKQSFLENEGNIFQKQTDLCNIGNIASAANKPKTPTLENPSNNSPVNSSMSAPMISGSTEMAGTSETTKPVKNNDQAASSIEANSNSKQQSSSSNPSSKPPEIDLTSESIINPQPEKPKSKEEREEQRRKGINAFSEYIRKQKEELARKEEERKFEQERRKQEEIEQRRREIEQRKRLKSVRIPKRNKEFSPLVSPDPSSPDSIVNASSQSESSISGAV